MVEEIGDLAGLARTNPAMAFFLAMLLFSLAGIPPLAGFFAKFYVFLAAIKAGLFTLAVIGVLASVVGAYYYLLIVKIMYFDEPAPAFEPMPRRAQGRARRSTGLFNLLFFVYPGAAGRGGQRGREVAVLSRCSSIPGRPRPACGSSRTTRSARPMPRRWRSRAPASAARSGSPRERQTAGRGRRGRAWVSAPGNLYASLLLTDPAPPEHWPRTVVRRRAGGPRRRRRRSRRRSQPQLALKWPNDLLLDGTKFAGILIEGEGGDAGAVAIGIGVNCASHPADTAYPATDLAAGGARVVAAGRCSPRCRPRCSGAWRNGTAAPASPPSAPTGSRAPPASASAIRVRLADREVDRALRGARRRRAAWCCVAADGTRETIAAGDVLPRRRFPHGGRADRMARWPVRATNSSSRRSAASARSA